jgi:hypothetical protein
LNEWRDAAPERNSWYTVVGIMNDGAELNQTVSELQVLGVSGEDLTVVLKRKDPDEPEPFPGGTRYIVVPDDSRGLELAVGFAVVFVLSGLLFAFTTPQIGLALFIFFISLAAILVAGSFGKVGVMPILTGSGGADEIFRVHAIFSPGSMACRSGTGSAVLRLSLCRLCDLNRYCRSTQTKHPCPNQPTWVGLPSSKITGTVRLPPVSSSIRS